MAILPPAVPLLVAATANVTIRMVLRRCCYFSWPVATAIDFLFAGVLHMSLNTNNDTAATSSIAPWWGPLTAVASQWYKLLEVSQDDGKKQAKKSRHSNNQLSSRVRRFLTSDGPLGKGGYKVVQVLVAVLLWRRLRNEWPAIRLGPLPTSTLPYAALAIISVGVNGVLYLWSLSTKSRGEHKGVNVMVQPSLSRDLTWLETYQYAVLALVNAACEEITARWFWYQEFAIHYPNNPHVPNLAQASIFGIWHYYGIPSGWMGVILTFVYGWIMGYLMETIGQGGLFLPIVAHAIADFYIFKSIARGKARAAGKAKDT